MKTKLKISILSLCFSLSVISACNQTNNSHSLDEELHDAVLIINEDIEIDKAIVKDADISLPESVYLIKNGVQISVEPAVEIYAVILSLLESPIVTHLNHEYKKSVSKYFADMSNHDTVIFVSENLGEKLLFDMSYCITLMINNDFSLDRTAYDHIMSVMPAWHTGLDIDDFIGKLKAFYLDSNFEKFYQQNVDIYYEIIKQTTDTLPDWDVIGAMESFFGLKKESYNIVLSSLLFDGGFGPGVMRDSELACYSIIGPSRVANGLPVFRNTQKLTELLLHEFSHTFIIFTEASIDFPEIQQAIQDSDFLFDSIRGRMISYGYPLWLIAGEELILRAAVIHMLNKNQDADTDSLLRTEYSQGFIYIYDVYDIINEYINNRDEYVTFTDFIPCLLNELILIYENNG